VRRYRELLAVAGVVRLTSAVLASRLTTSMLNLALLVAATQAYGYATAGVVLTSYAVVNAVVGPVRGRTADRREPRRVMITLSVANTVAFGGLVGALAAGAPAPLLAAAAGVLGATVPPTGPVVRGLWPLLVPAERLPTAYAFDAALNTATFVSGPMVAGGLLLVLDPAVVVAITGAVKLVGDVLVAVAPALRAHQRTTAPHGRFFGPLGDGRVRVLLGMVALDTFSFGCLEVVAVAAARGQGSAGVFASLLAVGGVVASIGYGARSWPGSSRAQLITLHLGGAAVLLAGVPGAGAVVLVGAVFLVYGLVNGPVETLTQVLLGDLSPDGQRIEVFAWAFSVMWAAFGIGTTVAGRLVGDGDIVPPLLACVAAQVLIALVAVANPGRLRRSPRADG
jgi:MFS transporter